MPTFQNGKEKIINTCTGLAKDFFNTFSFYDFHGVYSWIFLQSLFNFTFFPGSQEMNDPLRKGTRDEKLSEQELK